MAETLRMGFAGLGAAATQVLPEISELPYIKLTAAADLRTDALERFQEEFDAEVYTSVEEMCHSRNVDAVYIATPHQLHAEHTIVALESGKHVIVEKPMALSIEDAERMNQTADRCGVKLMCGHTKTFDPPIVKMHEIVRSGELGRVCMIHTWNYNDFMVRMYPDDELAASRGVVLNQGPHQVDIVRLLGGGMVRSVRGMARSWDPSRPGEGAYAAYLEFDNGVPATMVYSGYGFFDTSEFHSWIGEGGQNRDPDTNLRARREYTSLAGEQRTRVLAELKEQSRYGASRQGAGSSGHARGGRAHQKFFGALIVSCEKGDLKQTQDGLMIYGDQRREISLEHAMLGRQAEVTQLYEWVVNGRPTFHDGRWGEATLEVCLGILKSAAERQETVMCHQVPAPA